MVRQAFALWFATVRDGGARVAAGVAVTCANTGSEAAVPGEIARDGLAPWMGASPVFGAVVPMLSVHHRFIFRAGHEAVATSAYAETVCIVGWKNGLPATGTPPWQGPVSSCTAAIRSRCRVSKEHGALQLSRPTFLHISLYVTVALLPWKRSAQKQHD